jgi:hypothetical protein
MSMTCAGFGPYETFRFVPVEYGLTLGVAHDGVGSVVRLVLDPVAVQALSAPAASTVQSTRTLTRRSPCNVTSLPLAGG